MTSRDFGAISLINGIMFMTANGSRSVLVPLHGVQAFGLTTTIMGAPRSPLPRRQAYAPLVCLFCSLLSVSCTEAKGIQQMWVAAASAEAGRVPRARGCCLRAWRW